MPTAAAERAAEAEKERLQREKNAERQRRYRETHAEELRQKRKKTATLEELSVSEPFPADTVIAAAVNQANGFTVVEAEGHHANKHVIIENVSLDGVPVHRVKTVQYSYHKSFAAALTAAKSNKLKLQFFRSGDADAS